MRVSFVEGGDPDELEAIFASTVAERFGMWWRLRRQDALQRVALMVSKYDHCLLDLLWRWRRGRAADGRRLGDLQPRGLPRRCRGAGPAIRAHPGGEGKKADAEDRLVEEIAGSVDLVVLARYMQILSGDLIERLAVPIINIHHSFLPAFAAPAPTNGPASGA